MGFTRFFGMDNLQKMRITFISFKWALIWIESAIRA